MTTVMQQNSLQRPQHDRRQLALLTDNHAAHVNTEWEADAIFFSNV